MTHEKLQKQLITFLWLYEAAVISACLIGGWLIATGQGGTSAAAAPLFLVAVAEMLRIPVSALSTRIGFGGRVLSMIVLVAIAIISFEALALIFEQFLDNRSISVMHAQRDYDRAAEALTQKQQQLQKATGQIEIARTKVAALDAAIASKEAAAPVQPGFSGKTCAGSNGRAVTCASDRQARADYSSAQKAHIATLTDLRAQRKAAQTEMDTAAASLSTVSVTSDARKVNDARQALTDIKTTSPMHKLAASLLGVKVADLGEEQFETVKRWGVLGLAGAFATLSAAVSLVAHQPEHTGQSKVSRAIRSYLARRRKAVVRIVDREVPVGERVIEVPVEVPGPERVVIRYLPAPYPAGEIEQRSGRRGMGTFRPARPEPLPANILGGE